MKFIIFTTFDQANRPYQIAVNPAWVWKVVKQGERSMLHVAVPQGGVHSFQVEGVFQDVVEQLRA